MVKKSRLIVRLPWLLSGKESTCQRRRCRFDPWVRKIPWRREWQPTPGHWHGESHGQRTWWAAVHGIAKSQLPGGSEVKNPHAKQERQQAQVQFLGQQDPLEEEMATHSSVLVWEIPRTEEPGWLQSMGSQRVRYN